jgi:hypothetical protein
MKMMCAAEVSLALLCAACSDSSVAASEQVTLEQCRSYYIHTYSLQGDDALKMLGEEVIRQSCAPGMVTKRHYECAMAVNSVEALQSCGPPNNP